MIITGKVIETWDDKTKGSTIRTKSIKYEGVWKEYEVDEILPLGEEVIIHMDITVAGEEFESPEIPMADKEDK